MKKYKKRRNEKKRKAAWIISLIAGAVFLTYFFLPSYSSLKKHIKRNKTLKTKIQELERENAEIRVEIYKLEEDPLYIEKLARKELGMMRPGETIYRMLPDAGEDTPATTNNRKNHER